MQLNMFNWKVVLLLGILVFSHRPTILVLDPISLASNFKFHRNRMIIPCDMYSMDFNGAV